jgi:hypothetical protein
LIIEDRQCEVFKLSDLTVQATTFHNYVLQVRGSGWILTSTPSWRLAQGGAFICGAGQPSTPELVRRLHGKSIEAVAAQSALLPADPVFELSGGMHLEIFSDQASTPGPSGCAVDDLRRLRGGVIEIWA